MAVRPPKLWCLTKEENINSFTNWKQNMEYGLSLDPGFARYLVPDHKWKDSSECADRGYTTDAGEHGTTALQKRLKLEMMLGMIANYCPVISRDSIVEESTSLNSVWEMIRLHFGFFTTGAQYLDLALFVQNPGEKPEDLFQRLKMFVSDNLIAAESSITHMGKRIVRKEQFTPSLMNMVTVFWLMLIHKDLPQLVKQRYGPQLRDKTISSLRSDISLAMSSLLAELHTTETVRAITTPYPFANKQGKIPQRKQQRQSYRRDRRPTKNCVLCAATNRNPDHFLSECRYLPESDKRYMSRARAVAEIFDTEQDSDISDDEDESSVVASCKSLSLYTATAPAARRVDIVPSPIMYVYYDRLPICLTLDTGATTNMMRADIAKSLGSTIHRPSQAVRQADGVSTLKVVGEIHVQLSRDDHEFIFDALVVETLDVDVLAGQPFLTKNDVAIRPATREIALSGQEIIEFFPSANTSVCSIRSSSVIRCNTTTTVWPEEHITCQLPAIFPAECLVSLEPNNEDSTWPKPAVVRAVGGSVRIYNDTDLPIIVPKHSHMCKVFAAVPVPKTDSVEVNSSTPTIKPADSPGVVEAKSIRVDPEGTLPSSIVNQFKDINNKYAKVFRPDFQGYNGAFGAVCAKVNMGKVLPPQRKGRLPQYAREKLGILQEKYDEMEALGVIVKPETRGITVENLSPSMLVAKSNGSYRLVTAFNEVGRFARPQPSLMPDVESTLRNIASWKHIAVSDLKSAFFQIPLSKDSMKFCGVCTPYKGIRVYCRSAMGMPGSETALEELMCRVLGDLLQDGQVAKIADDLFIGGNTPEELLNNWEQVLSRLYNAQLVLSADKTIIAPRTTVILGWKWSQGSISATPHRISTLSNCALPTNVKGIRSFVGAMKILARVVPNLSALLAPIEEKAAGKQSNEKITWNEKEINEFKASQDALSDHRSITIPRPTDKLWLLTDAANIIRPGIGCTLYVTRDNQRLLAGFFSAKMKKARLTWLPCEIEALAISVSISHFAPYIVQSLEKCTVLTDSKPCVQAVGKLERGQFSSSPRVSTFLSTIARYQVDIVHLPGAHNLPTDFGSRNAPECTNSNCQICSFIVSTADSVVLRASVQDYIDGKIPLPYTSRSTWKDTQQECYDLRRTHSYLTQGTHPTKKQTKIKDIKWYLNTVTLAPDGLLVVKMARPFTSVRDRIVVPRAVLQGLLTALHLKLLHPSKNQLKLVFERFFFALDADKCVETVTDLCHQCAAVKVMPHCKEEQSTSSLPDRVCQEFSADVLKRHRQCLLVIREEISAYTFCKRIPDETTESVRSAILTMMSGYVPLDGPPSLLRTDNAPCFRSLPKCDQLQAARIQVELGRVKNINKNPSAERAIQEIEHELLRLQPGGDIVSDVIISRAVNNVNKRLRADGLSAREIIYQRDQFTGEQIHFDDILLIQNKSTRRVKNHPHSSASKCPLGPIPGRQTFVVGDLIYIKSDYNKSCARDRYIVVKVDDDWCHVRKFTGTQFRSALYKVKHTECFKVPTEVPEIMDPIHHELDSDSDNSDVELIPKAAVPKIRDPVLIEELPDADVNDQIDTTLIDVPPITDVIPPEILPTDTDIITENPEAHPSNHSKQKDIAPVKVTGKDQSVPTATNSRPHRSKKKPKYLKDYVTI